MAQPAGERRKTLLSAASICPHVSALVTRRLFEGELASADADFENCWLDEHLILHFAGASAHGSRSAEFIPPAAQRQPRLQHLWKCSSSRNSALHRPTFRWGQCANTPSFRFRTPSYWTNQSARAIVRARVPRNAKKSTARCQRTPANYFAAIKIHTLNHSTHGPHAPGGKCSERTLRHIK